MIAHRKGLELSLLITGRTFTTMWLLFFYLFSIWLVLGTLSSHQFQSDMRKGNIGENGDKNSYPVMMILKILELEDDLREIETNMKIGEEDISRVRSERDLIKVEYSGINSRFDHAKAELKAKLTAAGEKDAAEDFTLITDDLIEKTKEKAPNLLKANETYRQLTVEAEKCDTKMNDADFRLEQSKSMVLEYRSRSDLIIKRIDDISTSQNISDERINDLRYMRKIYVNFLALMPSQMLTLLLTLTMGALGSIIYLTRTFIDFETDKPFSWYIFRTFLGMITSIAMFILVKAGQIVISDSSSSDGVFEINPFFISFLAIVSGILSEQAYEKLQGSGRAFFRVDDAVEARWAFHLKEELAAKNIDPSELCALTGAPMETVEKWITEKQKVNAREQELIGAYLKKEVRELFSDQSPRQE